MERQPNAPSLPASALPSSPHNRHAPRAKPFESTDAAFSVSWLLGLQPPPPPPHVQTQAVARNPPEWAKHLSTADPAFSVSWLLGLQPRPSTTGPPWVKQYQTDDADFLVSRLLGLIPASGALLQKGLSKLLNGAGPPSDAGTSTTSSKSDANSENVDWQHDFNEAGYFLAQLYGDCPYVDDDSEDDSGTDDSSQAVHDSVTLDPEFLDLCERLEDLLDEIEASSSADQSDTESIDGISPEDCEDDSPARSEWLRQKTVELAENTYLDRLMSLTGLEETKALFLHAKAKMQAAIRRGTDLDKENFDLAIIGNEGTGKSTVARLYASFLLSLGVIKKTKTHTGVIEHFSTYNFSKTTALDTMRNISMAWGGCIVVLDDCQLLNRDEVNLWNFYMRSREIPGKVVIILAGDYDSGFSNVLNYSAEVEKHFQLLTLPNYKPEELQEIYLRMFRKWFDKKMELERGDDDRNIKILTRRITAQKVDDKSFANIWVIKKAFIDACRRQVERFRQARAQGKYLEDYRMTKEDILGTKPLVSLDESPAWKELQTLVGIDGVKQSIESVLNQVRQNHDREMAGQDLLPISANRVFLGPPGTGKTTVARLYGQILSDLGLLSKGKLVLKTPADLIDRYIGGSESNTKEALQAAAGSVLIIDDAHMLDPGTEDTGHDKNGDFRGGILDTIVAEVSGCPGEDRCVILCGYQDKMEQMYQNCNPGFARRFPLGDAFVFTNFDRETLGKILDLKLEQRNLKITDKGREVAMSILDRASGRPNFGNGGEVETLVMKGVSGRTQRMAKDESANADQHNVPLEPQDFDADWDRHTRAVANTRALFKDFVGYEDIVSKFESYQYIAQGMRLRGIDPRPYIPFTYVFKGPPGTGKTSTARKLGQIFYDMGFLSAPDVVEVSASQLVGEYCGQTGPKTVRLLQSAIGKVLFIDEAYRLAGDKFMEDAVSELVDAVTKPQYQRKMVIVLAGYEEDMERLMKTNHGLRSRFPTEFMFRPMRVEQCMEQLRHVVGHVGITIQSTMAMDGVTRNTLTNSLNRMMLEKGWASGRSVETLGEKIIGHVFKECAIKGYTGKELHLTGRELVIILGASTAAANGHRGGVSGGMGARQVMTLRDLEGYE
ncbi:hypothetical protein S40293_04737 [Stachybotrys chartarum IBT 40293]|nr:hypothetical protein S40293_04737 [Stachybotrys chartarum IBT 40293]